MDNVVAGDKIGWYLGEEIPGTKRDIGGKPSLRRELFRTNI